MHIPRVFLWLTVTHDRCLHAEVRISPLKGSNRLQPAPRCVLSISQLELSSDVNLIQLARFAYNRRNGPNLELWVPKRSFTLQTTGDNVVSAGASLRGSKLNQTRSRTSKRRRYTLLYRRPYESRLSVYQHHFPIHPARIYLFGPRSCRPCVQDQFFNPSS
ncbi:hypothetical protein VTK26DRAFT_4165 [Humicola hyalothermophila]